MQPIDFEYFHLNEQKIRTFPTIKPPHFNRKYICIGLYNIQYAVAIHTRTRIWATAYVPVACIWIRFRCIVLHVTSSVESHCWWMDSLSTVFPTFRVIRVLFVYTDKHCSRSRTHKFIYSPQLKLALLDIPRCCLWTVVYILNLFHCIHSAVVLFHFNI